MGKAWRLILDQKNDGYYNMAVDEAMLSSYRLLKTPTLRVYGWKEPFVSLGYNQDPQKVLNPQEGIPFVRRITGGSAILHGQELTYSLICSLEDLNLSGGVKESYRTICSFLKYFYKQLGLEAYFAKDLVLSGQKIPKKLGEYKNSCFSAWQHCDLLIGGKKIGGNAQRRKKNIIFQHGSIPQEMDPVYIGKIIKGSNDLKERATSLKQALGKSLDFHFLSSLLSGSFESIFRVKFSREILSPLEREKTAFFLEKKYRTKMWNNYKISGNA